MAPHPLLALRPDSPVGLVFSGGGARGAYQIGVWKVLREHGLGGDPQVVSGTSSGAINAILIAAGLSPDDMLGFWLDLARDPPVVGNEALFASLARGLRRLLLREPLRPLGRRGRELRLLGKLLRSHRLWDAAGRHAALLAYLVTARFDVLSELLDQVSTTHLFDTRPMRERLCRAIGGETLRSGRVRLAINAMDVQTGRVVRLVNCPPSKRSGASAAHYHYHEAISVDMVLASASIPLLFNPVRVDGALLWDGGLLVNTPLAPAVALGARRIVPVLATAGGRGTPAELDCLGAAVERLVDAFLENAYNVDRKMLLDRNVLARGGADPELRVVELFQAVRPDTSRTFNAGSYLYFEREAMLRMFEAGERAGRLWLERGPLRDERERG
ncbi:MAG: patatin-like phospholipase family protein [Deltaproteobacteria bacterium]|nr:patatin-like phospholipase family protein [Deltaproteobacteria bacterium]